MELKEAIVIMGLVVILTIIAVVAETYFGVNPLYPYGSAMIAFVSVYRRSTNA